MEETINFENTDMLSKTTYGTNIIDYANMLNYSSLQVPQSPMEYGQYGSANYTTAKQIES